MAIHSFLRRSVRTAGFVFLAATLTLAQRPGGTGGGSTGGGTGGGRPGGGRPTPPPTQQPGQRQPGPLDRDANMNDLRNTIYLSGKVMMEDGTAPPERVMIQRVCNSGNPLPEAHTDSKGRFSFQLGQNSTIMADASTGGIDQPSFGTSRGQRNFNQRDLMGCEIRAYLPGFRSSVVSLSGRRALDNPDLGTIVLYRLGKVEGYTFSATSGLAPKDARKAFEKGTELLSKNKVEEAEKQLTKSVEIYPKYAAAWNALGIAYLSGKKVEDAKRAFNASLEADAKFVNPYTHLARIAATERKWDETLKYTGELLRLNPFLSPEGYFYSAVAHYNLKNMPKAEEHAREAAKMDEQRRIPRINHLLGVILAEKQDYNAAAEQMRIYIKAAPENEAALAKQQLSELEKRIAAAPRQ